MAGESTSAVKHMISDRGSPESGLRLPDTVGAQQSDDSKKSLLQSLSLETIQGIQSLQTLHSLQHNLQAAILGSNNLNQQPQEASNGFQSVDQGKSRTGTGSVGSSRTSDHDREERASKRRSQIAAASRKSRAKRKAELVELKEENQRLWKEILLLKAKLGQGVVSDAIERKPKPASLDNSPPTNQPTIRKTDSFTKSEMDDDVFLGKMTSFMQQRLTSFFQQLKTDTIGHFAFDLPYSCKEMLTNLDVDFQFTLNDTKKPKLTSQE